MIAYTVACRQEVPSTLSWRPVNKSLNAIVVAASARLGTVVPWYLRYRGTSLYLRTGS